MFYDKEESVSPI